MPNKFVLKLDKFTIRILDYFRHFSKSTASPLVQKMYKWLRLLQGSLIFYKSFGWRFGIICMEKYFLHLFGVGFDVIFYKFNLDLLP